MLPLRAGFATVRRRIGWVIRDRYPNRAVVRNVQGVPLVLPWSHRLPDYAGPGSLYGQNLVELARLLAEQSPLTVLDVGANVGDSALQILDSTDGRVLCVEGDRYYLDYLHRNVDADSRVTVVEALLAVGGTAEATTAVRAGGTTHFVRGEGGDAMPSLTPSALREAYPAFANLRLVKSDTDGYDVVLVPKIAAAWASAPPVLFFEYDPYLTRIAGHDPLSVWPSLAELGYRDLVVWDHTGRLLGRTTVDNAAALSRSLDDFPPRRPGSRSYWDVAVVHEDDAVGARVLDQLASPEQTPDTPDDAGNGAVPTPQVARGSAVGRAGLVTFDQALSSITNLLPLLWVAHTLSVIDFGSFSLVMLVYAFALGPIHAVVSMRVLVHPDDADHRPRDVLGSAFLVALVAGAGCCAVGGLQTLVGWSIGPAMLILGLCLPLLVLQDVARWVGIARGAPGRAIALDATWLALLMAAFTAVQVVGGGRLWTMVLAWAGTGAVAALLVPFQYGVFHRGEVSLRWLRSRWDQSWRQLISNLTSTGSALAGAALVAVVSGPVAVAAVRASLLLARPTSAVQTAVASSAAADIARERPDNRGLLRHQRRTMAMSAVVGFVNLGVLILLPDPVGEKILGNVWPVIAPLLLPVALRLIAAAAQSGIRASLMGRQQFHAAMVTEIIAAPLLVLAMVIGAAIDDAAGAVWGMVIGQAAISACWWVAMIWLLRRGVDPTGRTLDDRSR